MASFFETTFGFNEAQAGYLGTQQRIAQMYEANPEPFGTFSLHTVDSVPRQDGVEGVEGKITVKNIVGDVRKPIQANPGALFQMASQSNFLEMANEKVHRKWVSQYILKT